MLTSLILHGVATLMASGAAAAGGVAVPDDLICPGILLRGQVRSIEKPPGASVNLQVVEVYAGESRLRGRLFTLKTNFNGQKTQGWPGLRSTPPLGAEGIFIMRLEEDQLIFDQAHATIGSVQLPVLTSDPGGEYEIVAAWAGRVREIYAMSPILRFDALRRALMEEPPEISAWAMEAFGRASVKESPQALDALVGESQLPLAAQVVLDKYLCEARATIWLDTPVRIKMMESWVGSTRNADEKSQRLVVGRLTQAAATRQNSGRMTLQLVQRALANTAIPETVKQSYLHVLTRSRGELATSSEAFELLSNQIANAASAEMALSAAVALKEICVLDGSRRAVLEGIRRHIKDPKVAEMLQQAIQAPGR